MGLLSFDKSAYLEKQKEKEELFKTLRRLDKTRFLYPPKEVDNDELSKLLSISWQNISFPITNITSNISHDIAQHKYPNRDGARVESMGRNPVIFSCTAVFANTITPGVNENWKKGDLYPNIYRIILEESLKSKTGILVHPFLGQITAKIISFKSNINSKFRGGELVDISFIETISETQALDTDSLVSKADAAAAFIDNSLLDLDPSPEELGIPEYERSFTDLLRDVKATIDQTELFFRDANSSYDEIKYRCNEIKESAVRLNDSKNAAIKQTAENLRDLTTAMRHDNIVETVKSDVSSVIISDAQTLSEFSISTGNTLVELMTLNGAGHVLDEPVIPEGTELNFYDKVDTSEFDPNV